MRDRGGPDRPRGDGSGHAHPATRDLGHLQRETDRDETGPGRSFAAVADPRIILHTERTFFASNESKPHTQAENALYRV